MLVYEPDPENGIHGYQSERQVRVMIFLIPYVSSFMKRTSAFCIVQLSLCGHVIFNPTPFMQRKTATS